jgi:Domain of Unknown Function (DUF928)
MLRKFTRILTISMGMFVLSHNIPEIMAQRLNNPPNSLSQRPDLSNRGTPKDNRRGSATRSDKCVVGQLPLTSLVPVNKRGEVTGLTVSQYPTFFFFVPQTVNKVANFTLVDMDQNIVSKNTIKLSGSPGVMSLKIADSSGLQVGKNYKWTLAIVCNPEKRSEDEYVWGYIQRVDRPDLIDKLRQANPRDRPSLYAREGIWYETLATIVEQHRINPNDKTSIDYWQNLLREIGLNDISQAPFI